ncbi:MAG: glycosyltransferase, partial [Pseudomonadota bacterium]
SNTAGSSVAAAAGGCILVRTEVLRTLGGFAILKSALIDDCTLAKKVKQNGFRTWIGLTRDVKSLRAYDSLGSIWRLVSRSAFTQLHYSTLLLLGVTAVFCLVFFIPYLGLFSPDVDVFTVALVAVFSMWLGFVPVLHYYEQSLFSVVVLPLIGLLYLLMTWTSAVQHWFGAGAAWKGRHYGSLNSDSVQAQDVKMSQ